jgi:uncharacterized protein (TIGR03067 family)
MASDLDDLQGSWSIVALEAEGMAMPAGMLRGAKIVVEGSGFKSIAMGAVYEGIVELDANTQPKTLAMKFTAGPENGNTNFGIYELVGDSWKICINLKTGAAPAGFATSAGSGYALEVLTRDR